MTITANGIRYDLRTETDVIVFSECMRRGHTAIALVTFAVESAYYLLQHRVAA